MNYTLAVAGRKFLSDTNVWPGSNMLDIDGWIENFDEGRDREIAVSLLLSYVHLNEEHIRNSLKSTVRALSTEVEFGGPAVRADRWKAFLDSALFSYPEGKDGDTAASGRIFMRIVKEIGIRDDQILDPPDLIKHLHSKDRKAVIFLDDLSGTGNQFCQHWSRKYSLPIGKHSLADIDRKGKLGTSYFLPLVATAKAQGRIESETPIRVLPSYLLGNEYFILDTQSRIAPSYSRNELESFLEKYSPRVEKSKYGVFGYSSLGMALSFHHGIPNNTLPIFRQGQDGSPWRSLVKK